ncbi:division/cell wall cluster transcriptional repressor MraZ [Sphingobium aquiterrae]|uniref:division/cell wall cluster transcriptional repressor MraZ n=1 Tax=Sphingobium aquiterrae TaxID=2038656 RepID=UPI00301B27A6
MSGDIHFSGNAFSVADGKGRFVLPLEMRKLVRKSSSDEPRLRVALHEKHGCAIGFGLSYEIALEQEISQAARLAMETGRDYDADAAREAIFPLIENANFDDGGRFSLSEDMREECGIDDVLFFVGVSRYIQIWSPQRYLESEGRPELLKNKVRRFLAEREGGRK